jgi:hypothetical protein
MLAGAAAGLLLITGADGTVGIAGTVDGGTTADSTAPADRRNGRGGLGSGIELRSLSLCIRVTRRKKLQSSLLLDALGKVDDQDLHPVGIPGDFAYNVVCLMGDRRYDPQENANQGDGNYAKHRDDGSLASDSPSLPPTLQTFDAGVQKVGHHASHGKWDEDRLKNPRTREVSQMRPTAMAPMKTIATAVAADHNVLRCQAVG